MQFFKRKLNRIIRVLLRLLRIDVALNFATDYKGLDRFIKIFICSLYDKFLLKVAE